MAVRKNTGSMVVFVVTGPTTWGNRELVEKALSRLVAKYGIARLLCVHGGAVGLDSMVEDVCAKKGIHTARIDARWGARGREAGPIRNGVMLALGVRFVVAFHWDLEDSRGTANCVKQARKAGIPVAMVWAKTRRHGMGPELEASLDELEAKRLAKRQKREDLAYAATHTAAGKRRKTIKEN